MAYVPNRPRATPSAPRVARGRIVRTDSEEDLVMTAAIRAIRPILAAEEKRRADLLLPSETRRERIVAWKVAAGRITDPE